MAEELAQVVDSLGGSIAGTPPFHTHCNACRRCTRHGRAEIGASSCHLCLAPCEDLLGRRMGRMTAMHSGTRGRDDVVGSRGHFSRLPCLEALPSCLATYQDSRLSSWGLSSQEQCSRE